MKSKKRNIFISGLLLVFLLSACKAHIEGESITDVPKTAEISFTYNPQEGSGSNQYAVWIEDENGEYIKTLYVTKYAGDGGWRVKEDTLPVWVEAVADTNLDQPDVDAVSGVTPTVGGVQTFLWDRTTQKGLYVEKGNYYFFVEANLRDDTTVLYTGQIKIGEERDESYAIPQYFGDMDAPEKTMIEDVKAIYQPAH